MRHRLVPMAEAQIHASQGSSHRRIKLCTIAPPTPVSSRAQRRRRGISRRRPALSASESSSWLASASSAAQAARSSPAQGSRKPSTIASSVIGISSERRSESNSRQRSMSRSRPSPIHLRFCQSPRTQRCSRRK